MNGAFRLGVVASSIARATPDVPNGMYLGATVSPATSSQSIDILMPAVVNAGDLLIIQLVNNSNSTPSTPSGWTSLVTTFSSTALRQTLFYKLAEGVEGGTSLPISVAGGAGRSAIVHRFQAGSFGGISATGASGNSSAPDSPQHTSGFGSVNTFWLSLSAWRGDAAVISFPLASNRLAHYPDAGFLESRKASCAACSEENSAAIFNPGAYEIGASTYWVAHTVAIEVA